MFQAEQFLPVQRDPYEGPVPGDGSQGASGNAGGFQDSKNQAVSPHTPGEMYSRPPTRSGGRNMQDSTFQFGTANSEFSMQ